MVSLYPLGDRDIVGLFGAFNAQNTNSPADVPAVLLARSMLLLWVLFFKIQLSFSFTILNKCCVLPISIGYCSNKVLYHGPREGQRKTAPEHPPGMLEQAGRWHDVSVCVCISDKLNFTCKLSFCLSQPLNEADVPSENVKQWLESRINS